MHNSGISSASSSDLALWLMQCQTPFLQRHQHCIWLISHITYSNRSLQHSITHLVVSSANMLSFHKAVTPHGCFRAPIRDCACQILLARSPHCKETGSCLPSLLDRLCQQVNGHTAVQSSSQLSISNSKRLTSETLLRSRSS